MKNEINDILNKNSINYSCCVTGYRPMKCPWGYNEQDERCLNMKKRAREIFINIINDGYYIFWSGMALGFDMICVEILLELKNHLPKIEIYGALPCKNQDCKWNYVQQKRYKELLTKLNGTRCIYDYYIGSECMLERNRFMIDNSSLVIALFDGKAGGTAKTLQYAKQKNRKIALILP